MRLGGPIFEPYHNSNEWVSALEKLNYRAAFCPQISAGFSVSEYERAARQSGIVVAEVGAWRNNPLSRDGVVRRAAILTIQDKLVLADEIGARCCVNVAGSRGERWDGPDAGDLTQETFDLIVETVREIVDAVKPKRTYFTLETMPWMFPDSPESYLRLLRAIDRPAFAVHFDPVNLINSPRLYFRNGDLIRQFVDELGAHIKSVHIKDILLRPALTTHLDEVRPGTGALDYRTLLRELDRLDPDLPIMLEHMQDPNDYILAAEFVRQTAARENVQLL
jgi:sugar phosphate isomerase/epimerase